MKKTLLTAGAASLAIAMIATGCATTSQEEKDELQKFLIGSRAAEHIEKTEDKGIDALAENSTILYKRIGVSMREYIEKTRGDMATIITGRQIRNLDTKDADGIKIAEEVLNGPKSALTDMEKKDWTAEKLYKAAKEKRALQYYIASRADNENGAKLRSDKSELVKSEIAEGEKIYKATLSKENWSAKIAEMEKYLNDLGVISKNTGVYAQDLAQKINAKTNDLAVLNQNPAMQQYIADAAALNAKKTFANDAKKKEIDAEIKALEEKPEYKPLIEKKTQYTAELEKYKKDQAVLANGIGKQTAYSGKAIPWLIKEYTAMSKL